VNWLDIAIIAFVIIGAVQGYRSGFLLELFSLLGILLGVLLGFKLLGVSLLFLSDRFDIDRKILPYAAFFVVFLAVIITVNLLGRALRASISKSFLGRVDEAAGAFLGMLKSVFILSVLMWISSSLKVDVFLNLRGNSELAPYVSAVAPVVAGWLSDLIPALGDIF
jgi:membrane protein required for colicin V production